MVIDADYPEGKGLAHNALVNDIQSVVTLQELFRD